MRISLFIILFFSVSSAFAQDPVLTKQLSGKVMSLNITPVRDTAVRIKMFCGQRAISTNPPLLLVDGVQQKFTDLNVINPNDILSIDVLKNSVAIEKFGKSAEHGVILITTKCKKPAANQAL